MRKFSGAQVVNTDETAVVDVTPQKLAISHDKITLSPILLNSKQDNPSVSPQSVSRNNSIDCQEPKRPLQAKLLKDSNDLAREDANSDGRRPRIQGTFSQSARSRKSGRSVPPGSIIDTANRAAQLVFKYISDNDYRELETMLEQEKEQVDVTLLKESRMYSALSFAAFKNHQ